MSPGTSSAAGTVFHTPSRCTDAVSARRDFNAARVAWARALLEQAECGIEHQENGDDRGLDIFAEHQFEHDRSLEHPRNGRPEFFQRRAQRMDRRIGHRVGAKLLQPMASLVARQADVRDVVCGICRFCRQSTAVEGLVAMVVTFPLLETR
jgi:hypothetical protein